ncbi:HPr family phosphocarrier protein [Paenibacillus ehimensis]|uniref:HPr family phosphocarrier protein n=1 Tax=Paenibacillus ehimensis TaxID=79264 RepID=UPI000FD9C79F|nr:HPr family phosphocarrier protein [Paenibacillus ehimensis]
MVKEGVTVKCQAGLHTRPAKLFALAAQRFRADITVEFEGRQAKGKSIISLLQLGAPRGSRLWVSAEGEDEREAVRALCELLRGCE